MIRVHFFHNFIAFLTASVFFYFEESCTFLFPHPNYYFYPTYIKRIKYQYSSKANDDQQNIFSDGILDEVGCFDVKKTIDGHPKSSDGRITQKEPCQVASEPTPEM
jgi:hypothetical protein